ncbi:hypothetical protein VAH18_003503 [Providencia rettgeri]|nr:hypothetical protein [Providencia rettgeri]
MFSKNFNLYDVNILKESEDVKKIPLQRYKSVNPSIELLKDEWKIAWLFIAGMSYRQIASFLNVSRTTVENKMKSSYGKLGLLGEDNFKYVADNFSWKQFIPIELLKDFFVLLD